MFTPWKENYHKPREHIKKQRHRFANKGPSRQIYGFSNSHVRMWELDHKEGWALKKWCFQIGVLEKTPESPLDCKEIKAVNPEGNQPWMLIRKNWCWSWSPNTSPTDAKNQHIGKDPDAGKEWGQEEKGMTEDEIVGWHHWLNGRGFEQTLGDSGGQGNLLCCGPWGQKESDMT